MLPVFRYELSVDLHMGAEVQEEWRRWAERSAWTTQERLQAADGRRTVETGSNNFETAALSGTDGE
jgi:hypothetical protein